MCFSGDGVVAPLRREGPQQRPPQVRVRLGLVEAALVVDVGHEVLVVLATERVERRQRKKKKKKRRRAPPQPHPRVYELDGLKLLDLEDATVEIAVRRRLRSATRK